MQKPSDHIKGIDFYKGVTIIRLIGGVTYHNLKSIQDDFALKTKGKAIKNILFDIKEVPETDTSGVAALVDLLKYMKSHQAGDKIGLVNVSPKVNSLLAISKTHPLFNEYSSEEEAIENLK